jgi:hypothetical protein
MNPDDEADVVDDGEVGNGYAAPEFDPFTTAIALCEIAQRAKPIAAALKQLRKVGRDIAAGEAKLAAVTAQAEQIAAAMTEREAAIAARERALEERETAFAASIEEARDNLRGYYNSIAEADRITRYRILSSADLLSNFNPKLQDLPSWDTIRRLVVGLPPDLPAAPPAEIVSENVREDWAGHTFVPGSTLTRSTSYKVTSQ